MKTRIAIAALPLALAACVTAPTGPSVMALPGQGKNFDQFRADDYECRNYAQMQSGATPGQAADDSGLRSAALGTAVGAVAGAAMGGHEGAGVGAGVGLIGGTLAGTGTAQASAHTLQQRYDNAYVQCMYAKGENVPVAGQLSPQRARYAPPRYAPPPPPSSAMMEQAPPPRPQIAPAPAAPQSAPAPQTVAVWYYCESANGYYPYVKQCPQPWKTVPATPPQAPR